MTTAPTISVAMATFNGARYLREQLESIASQTSLPDELVVGDDNSSDNTIEVIQDFAARAPFPVRLSQNKSRLGFGENFLKAAALCGSEWISFCDQDDFWLPEKLARVRTAIAEGPPDLFLVVHQAEVVDEDLAPTGRRLLTHIDRELVPRRGHKCYWYPFGMATTARGDVFRELDWSARPRDRIFAPQKMGHDVWSGLMANALGSTRFIAETCMWYRRHQGTATKSFASEAGSGSLRRSRADLFAWNAQIHGEVGHYLSELAQNAPIAYQAGLKEHADDFRRSSQILRNRETLDRERQFSKRIAALIENVRTGGYNPANNFGYGVRSLVIDVLKASGAF